MTYRNETKIGNTVILVEEGSSAATNRTERTYYVKAVDGGKVWRIVQDKTSAFPRFRVNGQGMPYETPAKAANAIAVMLRGF